MLPSCFVNILGLTPIPASIWSDDGTHGSQVLSPHHRVAAVGYAMASDTVSDGAITSANVANSAVGATHRI